jgi:predicted transcriptional regulator
MLDEQAQLAADQEFAAAIATGTPLDYDNTAPAPDLPPPGSPVMVVRPVRLPTDIDAAVKQLAAEHGVTPSALIRGWVESAVTGSDTDAVEELRTIQAAAARALERINSDRLRDAA